MVAGDGMVAERADLIVRNAKVTTLGLGRVQHRRPSAWRRTHLVPHLLAGR
jgi:hypothetical protein